MRTGVRTGREGDVTGTTTVHVADAKAPLGEILNYRSLVGNFVRRELRTRFKGSRIGWLWSLANPIATLTVYTVVFGIIFQGNRSVPTAGSGNLKSFAVYLFTGLVVWNIFAGVLNRNVSGLLEIGALRRKVYFPPIAPLTGITLAILVELGVEFGLLVAVYIVYGNIGWTFLLTPVVLALAAVFSFGLGLLLAVANARYRDVSYLLTIVLQLLFYMIPVIYPMTLVAKALKGHAWMLLLYRANPLTQYVLVMRELMWDLRWPSLAQFGYCVAWAAAMGAIGWVVFTRKSLTIAEQL
jgi:ABC-type polysaccharide/polyol phosphate export permease